MADGKLFPKDIKIVQSNVGEGEVPWGSPGWADGQGMDVGGIVFAVEVERYEIDLRSPEAAAVLPAWLNEVIQEQDKQDG